MEEITLKNNATESRRRMPCSAVFVFIGAEPAAEWLPAEIARDTNGYLLTGTDVMRSGLVAADGSRPVSAGDDASRRAGRRRHPRGLDQARWLRGGRRLAGGDLCPSFAVDRSLRGLRRSMESTSVESTSATLSGTQQAGTSALGTQHRAGLGMGRAWVVGDVLKCSGTPRAIVAKSTLMASWLG